MVKEANEKLKLCKRQARRVYEIVRLHWTKKAGPLNDDSAEYKGYRVDIKKRLNIPYQVRLLEFLIHGDSAGFPLSPIQPSDLDQITTPVPV